jgi:two-component system, response regulator PdtaR
MEMVRQTILVVDDEPLIRMHVRRVLENAGHAAKGASNAEEALRLINEGGITLLVTDIDMPGAMDGLALAREVRTTRPDIAVIVTSGHHPRAQEMPSDAHFLSKPISEKRLIALVEGASL